ncbi:hypothetical protein [uncultured Nocardioides sp.]|uniref:hypothetical protein n=1 Tax=uncultured Nocardioides sp. TaxID=198441 RepID=UPI0026134107|nr:hypothetical protein [uncultured Nocardioides sp.]
MRFTEREMTVGVKAVAQQLMVATKPFGRGSVEERWERLTPMGRYEKLAAAGELVLPLLVGLPDRPTVGATPEFTTEEWEDAAAEAQRSAADARSPGSWDALSERKRRGAVAVVVRLGRTAVAAMPVRQDPDAIVVPDHL